jgi:hypothetical protein
MLWKVKELKGNTLVQVALVVVVLFGIAALAIDGGMIFTARNQLQSAVDASALAGAAGLFTDEDEAVAKAIAFAAANTCIKEPVVVTPSDVTFPAEKRVRVEANHTVDLFFARIFGISTANITAAAEAEYGSLSGTGNVKPWAIPDLDYEYGELVLLKAGSIGAPGSPESFFYPVDFPPLNRGTPISGAQAYRDNILNGSDGPIFIGDELQVEPGNMIGPTIQGVNDVIALDPGAYWNGSEIAGSDFPEYTSPRVCKVGMYDIDLPPNPGKSSVTVVRLGAFFLEGMQGNNVMGRFLEITTGGTWGGGTSDLVGVKLVN